MKGPSPPSTVRRGDLRSGSATDHALLADQIGRTAGSVDAASHARCADTPATQIINALRAHLAELGFVAAQGKAGVNELRAIVTDEDRHQRLREKPDGHVFKGDRWEECVQMPGKMARSDPRPPSGLPVVAAVVRAANPPWQNTGYS